MALPVAPASVLPAAVASFFADIESTAASHDTAIAANTAYSPGGTDVAVADGGTGASTAAVARTNLGLVIGTDVAAQSSLDSLDWKASCRVCATTNVAVASGLVNAATVDGVTLSTGNRVLLTGQTAGAENGIWVVVAAGAASRATDADVSAEVTSGMAVVVTEGTANGDAIWFLSTNDPITLGTTALVFTSLSAALAADAAFTATYVRLLVAGTIVPSTAAPHLSFDPVLPYTKSYLGPDRVIEFHGGTSAGGGSVMPFLLSSYFGPSGGYSTGSSIICSNKRVDINGAIQGVSAIAAGAEPSMVAVAADVNGPCLALEAPGAMGAGATNAGILAGYDSDSIHSGATAYSLGYGRKTYHISSRGTHFWGTDLANTPLTSYLVKQEFISSGTMRFTSKAGGTGALEFNALDTSVSFRLKLAGTTQFQISPGATQSSIEQGAVTVMRTNSDGGMMIGGQDGSGMTLGVRQSNAGLPRLVIFQTSGLSEDMLRLWTQNETTILSRFDKNGHFMTRKVAAPADADVATSEMALWFDNTNGAGKAMFKGKTANGTVVAGSVALA